MEMIKRSIPLKNAFKIKKIIKKIKSIVLFDFASHFCLQTSSAVKTGRCVSEAGKSHIARNAIGLLHPNLT